MNEQFWEGITDIWYRIKDVITFKLSFFIPLLLFYFIYKTVKDTKNTDVEIKNKDKA
ncbi:MAG: hypothetical protein K0R31_1667 [Clostridiales bacterium]|nr:hypothetical protein [Clostridiales bacterium]